MTARNYHTPPQPGSTRARCPVCHEAVYSRAGIHPQCAVRQSEPPKGKASSQAPPADLPTDAPEEIEAVEIKAEEIEAEVAQAEALPRPARARPSSGRRPA